MFSFPIRRFATVFCVTVALVFGLVGCASVKTRVAERFSAPAYVTQTYAADSRTVFDAATAAVTQLNFRITRSGAAQGVIEGVSGLQSDDRLRGTVQRTIKVRLATNTEGKTEAGVLFTEIVEDDFNTGAGQGIETPLRNHPLYEAFFERLATALVR